MEAGREQKTMGKIDSGRLSPEGRSFVERVLAQYPNWAGYATTIEQEGRLESRFVIPSPTGDRDRDLVLSFNDDDGPIVSYGKWHDHIETLTLVSEEHSYALLWTWIEEILSDRKVLLVEKGEGANPFWYLIDFSARDSARPHKILSWTGKRDSEF